MVPANDLQSGTVTVRVLNVGVTAIVAPGGVVDSGSINQPRARVRNLGSTAVTFPVTFRIGSFYASTQNVINLAAGDSFLVSFASWTASIRGTFATRCSTALGGDAHRENDTLSGSVTVRVLNVSTLRIIAPSGILDSGTVVAPRARVRNLGTSAASFPVTFRIGTFYSSVQYVTSLAPGESALVVFPAWSALQRGTHATRCTTALAGDLIPANDAVSGSVTVRVYGDVGVNRILAPSGTVDSGTILAPQAVVWNYGSHASFPVTFRVSGIYSNTQNITDLAPGESVIVIFASWTANRRGSFALGCTTGLVGDTTPENNGAAGMVTVRVVDVGIVSIVSPSGIYEPGKIITPAAMVRNLGSVVADIAAWMSIFDSSGALYCRESAQVLGVAPGAGSLVNTFPVCTLRTLGNWSVRCSIASAGDMRPENNVASGAFQTLSLWTEVKSMPATPSGAAVKDGAWLAYNAGNGLIYAGKSNKTTDFYSYDPGMGNWTERKPVPYGIESKAPRKGACGTTNGSNSVFVAKGNNTLGFFRYDIASDSWQQLENVPAGAGKRVKAGAAAVYVQGYVYLLKGNCPEFYRFSEASGTWEAMASAPSGANPKWAGGSFLVYDGDQTIYAHKAKYHELWSYNTASGVWSDSHLPAMPIVGASGRAKKSKDGGSGTWLGAYAYALKGGKTNEFWRYDPALNTWTEGDTIPGYGSTGGRRLVSAGGSITNAGGALHVLKGNLFSSPRTRAPARRARLDARGVPARRAATSPRTRALARRARLDARDVPARRVATSPRTRALARRARLDARGVPARRAAGTVFARVRLGH